MSSSIKIQTEKVDLKSSNTQTSKPMTSETEIQTEKLF